MKRALVFVEYVSSQNSQQLTFFFFLHWLLKNIFLDNFNCLVRPALFLVLYLHAKLMTFVHSQLSENFTQIIAREQDTGRQSQAPTFSRCFGEWVHVPVTAGRSHWSTLTQVLDKSKYIWTCLVVIFNWHFHLCLFSCDVYYLNILQTR